MEAYQKSLETIFAEIGSSKDGLDIRTVETRQAEYGFNELETKERDSVLKLFVETFKDAMVMVLLAVAAIQMVVGHAAESLIIFAVLMINAIVSVIQTRKAEGSLDALKSLSAGDYVPADGRLFEAGSLKVDEAMLNGDVLPLTKELLEKIKEQNEQFSHRALRVLAFAYRPLDENEALDFNVEHDLILVSIAMGSGTDVAKEAAAMVLTDDNFVSIVSAVGVGRNVYDNIKKAIAYLFSGNLGAIIAIIAALLMDWVNPFTALQLLFINLVNDSIPAIALGMEKGEPDVMSRKPRNPNEGIFSGDTLVSVIYRGVLIGAAVILSQYIGRGYSAEMSVAMAFSTLIIARTLQTFPARSNSQTAIGAGFFANKYVLYAVAFCSTLYAVTLLPAVRGIFSIPADFGCVHFGMAAGLALAAVALMEVTKLIIKRAKN
nr:cation-translocating P-type ATPase C-terminal domain-containing protein [Trichococcus patagoniensis]